MLADKQEVLDARWRPLSTVSGFLPFRSRLKEVLCQQNATNHHLGVAPLASARYPTPRAACQR